MEIDQAYFEAAKAIASCPPTRLKLVIETFQKAGLDLPEPTVVQNPHGERDRTTWLQESRAAQDHRKWKDTADPFVLALRRAYDDGVSFTRLSKEVGVARCTMYQYLYGRSRPTAEMAEKIMACITKQ